MIKKLSKKDVLKSSIGYKHKWTQAELDNIRYALKNGIPSGYLAKNRADYFHPSRTVDAVNGKYSAMKADMK